MHRGLGGRLQVTSAVFEGVALSHGQNPRTGDIRLLQLHSVNAPVRGSDPPSHQAVPGKAARRPRVSVFSPSHQTRVPR